MKHIEVVDVHVGGDLHRIVLGGIAELPGSSVLEKMSYLRAHADGLRRILLHEPRGGHPSLFADLVVQPGTPGADAGFIIMELMGYPLISGTNTMSTVIALLETGRLTMTEGTNQVVLEAPGGLIDVTAECENGKVTSVTYKANTPTFVAASDLVVDMPSRGVVRYDIVWSGAFYPVIRAADVGFDLIREEEEDIVSFSKSFIEAVNQLPRPVHPVFGEEGPISFVVYAGELQTGEDDSSSCRVCCYESPRNSVCRAPAGVPSTSVLVNLVNKGLLDLGECVRTVSIFGTSLQANITRKLDYHGKDGFEAMVTGSGWITSKSQIVVDFSDPLTPQEGLEEILN
ncbi:proline racemase family protein [Oceanimonas doudoroffii]|nr:proline racemase family protein [Oceanimonas doudoroffii]